MGTYFAPLKDVLGDRYAGEEYKNAFIETYRDSQVDTFNNFDELNKEADIRLAELDYKYHRYSVYAEDGKTPIDVRNKNFDRSGYDRDRLALLKWKNSEAQKLLDQTKRDIEQRKLDEMNRRDALRKSYLGKPIYNDDEDKYTVNQSSLRRSMLL